jgi:hypothetical protein
MIYIYHQLAVEKELVESVAVEFLKVEVRFFQLKKDISLAKNSLIIGG